MIHFAVDNATFLFFVLLIILLVAGYLYWETRKKIFVQVLGVTLLLGLLLALLSCYVITDRKQIEINMRSMAQAAKEGKEGPILDLLSQDFQYKGEKRDKIAKSVVKTAQVFQVSNCHITDFTVTDLTHTKDLGQAEARFRLRVDYGNPNEMFLCVCKVTFVFEEGRWRVRTIKIYHAVRDEELVIPLQLQ